MVKQRIQFKMLKYLRIVSQILFSGYFIFIFIRSLDPFSALTNPFLRFDPIIYLSNPSINLARISIISGLIILTLIFGRFFCGWICPLGAMVDLIDLIKSKLVRYINPLLQSLIPNRFHIKNKRTQKINSERNTRNKSSKAFNKILIEYPPSIFILGLSIATVFSPLPLFQFLHPGIWIIRIVTLHISGIAFLIFLIIASLISKRFWCRYICPLGALYGLISKFSIFKLRINGCSNCGICSVCPMGAIPEERDRIINSQCILCFDFESRCPLHAFSYSHLRPELLTVNMPFKPGNKLISNFYQPAVTKFKEKANGKGKKPKKAKDTSLTRRQFIITGLTFTSSVALGLLLPGQQSAAKTTLLRPPGVTNEALFLKRCLRCQQCVRSCPNEIIKPVGLQQSTTNGLTNLYTPHLIFDEYGCDYYCQVCQIVCPNNAIPLQSLEEKQKTKIGIAKIDRELCVVYKDKKSCIVCEEFCPVPEKAVKLKKKIYTTDKGKISLLAPVVDSKLCIGCGICEAKCPAEEKAIRVVREV